MVRSLFDTNIIIDCLSGQQEALAAIKGCKEPCISIITYMEVLVGIDGFEESSRIKDFLLSLHIVHIDYAIANLAIEMRKEHKLKLPDALVLASARSINANLVTRDDGFFKTNIPGVKMPYRL